jgi:ABC-type transport system involved in cytochrome c biogenesis permease subunit
MHGTPLNFGITLTWATLVVALSASACALLWGQGRAAFARPARVLYALQVIGLATLAYWLAHLFLTHDFRYAYVSNYSSRAMEKRYVFASFWGGQEGTFLLWALWSTLLAALLFRVRNRLAPTAIFFANWSPIFLLLILTAQSPFRLLAHAAADGAGLNPLLQDPWMTIHPPTLFLGYASLILPFALAMATLVHRDEGAWIRSAPPFVLLSTVILGTGFTMGGLWAYKVLGWGGFWGWDPVENASLVPWLFNVALLHALLVQRATGALGRTTLFLALTSYLFVLYGSFLTRSGVLADFSVHSFVDLGLSGFLLAFLGVVRRRGLRHVAPAFVVLRPPECAAGRVVARVRALARDARVLAHGGADHGGDVGAATVPLVHGHGGQRADRTTTTRSTGRSASWSASWSRSARSCAGGRRRRRTPPAGAALAAGGRGCRRGRVRLRHALADVARARLRARCSRWRETWPSRSRPHAAGCRTPRATSRTPAWRSCWWGCCPIPRSAASARSRCRRARPSMRSGSSCATTAPWPGPTARTSSRSRSTAKAASSTRARCSISASSTRA